MLPPNLLKRPATYWVDTRVPHFSLYFLFARIADLTSAPPWRKLLLLTETIVTIVFSEILASKQNDESTIIYLSLY